MITRDNRLEVACGLAGPGQDSEAVESLAKMQHQVLELALKHLETGRPAPRLKGATMKRRPSASGAKA